MQSCTQRDVERYRNDVVENDQEREDVLQHVPNRRRVIIIQIPRMGWRK